VRKVLNWILAGVNSSANAGCENLIGPVKGSNTAFEKEAMQAGGSASIEPDLENRRISPNRSIQHWSRVQRTLLSFVVSPHDG